MEYVAERLEAVLPRKKIDIFGANQLLMNTFPYYLLAVLINMSHFGDPGSNIFMFIFIVYTGLPLLDEFLSFDIRNPTEEERKELESRDFYFKLALYVSVISNWIIFFKAMNSFATMEITILSVVKTLCFIFIFSNLESVQFAVAH